MDSSYSFWGMGKARPVCRALVGGVRFSVSGWTKCPEVGAVSYTHLSLQARIYGAYGQFPFSQAVLQGQKSGYESAGGLANF